MRHLEAQSQRALLKWWKFAHREFDVPEQLLVSIPNGGKRRIREAMLMKLEGCRRGAPDLVLFVARGGYHGMAIEMKTTDGRISPHQESFLSDMFKEGYYFEACRSTEQAIEAITLYLRQAKTT